MKARTTYDSDKDNANGNDSNNPGSGDSLVVFSVGDVTRLIKETLSSNFSNLIIEGEISNYIQASSGHRYFSLKDDSATLGCAMFRGAAASLKFAPENGMKVQAYGSIDVYPPHGKYQFIIRRLRPMGAGELEIAFRQLYARLEKEGLFAEERKKPLPNYPFTVGIVTSPTGAAIRDMINVFTRRNPLIKLVIYPAAVQGEGAEKKIAAGLDYFNTRQDIDLIITGRGGGSMEDLWRFNTEEVVRAIVRSQIPVITGVGHEVDWTLADHAADLRAPTPSAAAEIASWEYQLTVDAVRNISGALAESLQETLTMGHDELNSIMTRGAFANPLSMITNRSQTLDLLDSRFAQAARNSFREKQSALALSSQRLDSLSPLKTLGRGYSVTRDPKTGAVLRDVATIKAGDKVEVILHRGRLSASVESTSPDTIA